MKLEDLKREMSEAAAICADAMNQGKPQKVIKNLKDIAKGKEEAYNAEVARLKFLEWKEEGDPVGSALRNRYVENGKRISYKAVDGGRFTVEINDAKFKVNLVTLCEVVGIEYFHAPDWTLKVQKLALLLANALNKQLSNDPGFEYVVDQAAAEFEFADGADITSDTSIIKALQQTIDAIYFLPIKTKKGDEVNKLKVIKPAWVYVAQSMTRQGRDPGAVAISGTGKMVELIADVAHVIMTCQKFKLVNA